MFRKFAATIIVAIATLSPAAAAEDAAKAVLSIPAEVTEVATATWSDGDLSGVFRAIVLTSPSGDGAQAHLILQLMAVNTEGNKSTVHKTIAIKEIDKKELPNAFLAVEDDGVEDMVTWRVTSYNSKSNADIGVLVTVNAKGEVTVKDAPKEEDQPQGDDKK